jgi:hypothetical protein
VLSGFVRADSGTLQMKLADHGVPLDFAEAAGPHVPDGSDVESVGRRNRSQGGPARTTIRR